MIKEVLDTLKNRLEEFLSYRYDLPDGFVQIGGIPPNGEDAPNKLVLSIVNLERETSMGIKQAFRKEEGSTVTVQAPPWNINMLILLAAVYEDARYTDSLRILSSSISYIQQNSSFLYLNGQHFTLEMVSIDTQELTNIWSMFGSRYYPSILCKLRMLTFDGDQVLSTTREMEETRTSANRKS